MCILDEIAMLSGTERGHAQGPSRPTSPTSFGKQHCWQRASTKQLITVDGEGKQWKGGLVRRCWSPGVMQTARGAHQAASNTPTRLPSISPLPSWCHPKAVHRLIGFRGATIKGIAQQSGVTVCHEQRQERVTEAGSDTGELLLTHYHWLHPYSCWLLLVLLPLPCGADTAAGTTGLAFAPARRLLPTITPRPQDRYLAHCQCGGRQGCPSQRRLPSDDFRRRWQTPR
jgi:hypothetical protein